MLKKFFLLLSAFLIVHLGYHLRLQQFSAFPAVGDTQDEVKYAFNGLNLIKKGTPESWSWWDNYGNFPVVNIRDNPYRLVKPYFDDPPIFALIMGGYSLYQGMDTLEKVDVGVLRWPMLKLGALNILLLFTLVYLTVNFKTAILSSLFYATIPTIVLSSRLPLAENFLVTLSLSSLLFAHFYLKKKKVIYLILANLVCFIAPLTKQTGLYVPFALIFLFFAHKRYYACLTTFLTMLLSVLAWFGYGLYYDWDLFIHLQSIFSGREIRQPTTIINLFDTFRIGEKPMATSGLLLWGWISIISLGRTKYKEKFSKLIPLVSLASYLVLFSIMSGHNKGWYRIPFYPFLAWAMGVNLVQIISNPDFLSSFFFIALAFFQSFVFGSGERFFNQVEVKIYQVLLSLGAACPLIYELTDQKRFKQITRLLIIIAFILLIRFNSLTITQFQDQFWY